MISKTAKFLTKQAASRGILHYPAVAANYVGEKGLSLARMAGRAGQWAAKRPLRSAGLLSLLAWYGYQAPRRFERAQNNINPSKEFQV